MAAEDGLSQSSQYSYKFPGGWPRSPSPDPTPHRPVVIASTSDPLPLSTTSKQENNVINKAKLDETSEPENVNPGKDVDGDLENYTLVVYVATTQWERYGGGTEENRRRRVKVGFTDSVRRRQRQYIKHQCGLEIQKTFKTVNASILEGKVHDYIKAGQNNYHSSNINQYIQSVYCFGNTQCTCHSVNKHSDVFYTTMENDVWLHELIEKSRDEVHAQAERLIQQMREKKIAARKKARSFSGAII